MLAACAPSSCASESSPARREGYSVVTAGRLGAACFTGGVAVLVATYFLARALRR